MLGFRRTRIDFDWDALRCKPREWAKIIHTKNRFRLGIGAGATPAVVDLCARFFVSPFLPMPAEGVNGPPSMAGVMIHEFSHITLGTADHEYLCAYGIPLSFTDRIPIQLGAPNLLFEDKTKNADSYRCFARDVWLNGVNPIDIIVR